MKHYTLGVLYLAILFTPVYAQEPACRVGGEEAFIRMLQDDWEHIRTHEADFYRAADLRTGTLTELPVQFHIVRSTVGQTTVTPSTLEQAMTVMNRYFQQAGMRFYQCAAPKFVDDSNLQNFFIFQQRTLVARSYVDKVVNIYCVASIEGGGVGGYTYLPGSGQPDIIVMDEKLLLNSTLTHEMGHFFGLLHTHGASNCPASMPGTDELADGSNCATAGDFVCDTPADPGLLGAGCSQFQVDANCTYIGVARDAKGMPFRPDTRNVMSYSRSSCRDQISQGQYARMYATFLRYRTYLTCSDTTGPVAVARLSMESPAFLSPNPVRAGKPFTVAAQLKNTGDAGFAGKIRATLFNSQDQPIATISTLTLPDTLKPGASTSGLLSFSNPNLLLNQETYKIGLYYQPDTSLAYSLIGSEKYNAYFSFTVEGAPLSCQTPDSLWAAEVGLSHLSFTWTASPVQSAFFRAAYREKGVSTWTEVPNWNANRMTIVNRKPCTGYEFRVKTICPEGESDWSPILSVTTGGCDEAYCLSYGNSLRSYIETVLLGELVNTSGNNYGYGNYTALRAEVRPGGQLGVTLTPGMSSSESVRTVYWRIWADYNRDFDFDDPGELLFQATGSNNRSVSVVIGLPAGLTPGDIRLRISMDTGSFPSPCAVNNNREVEDYTLHIPGASFLHLSASSLHFQAEGGEASASLESSGNWKSMPGASWMQVFPASGGPGKFPLRIGAAAHTALTARESLILFETGSTQALLRIHQNGRLTNVTKLAFPHPGGVQELRINADTSWTIEQKPAWITVGALPADGQPGARLSILAAPNSKDSPRQDTLRLRWADGRQASIVLEQASNETFTFTYLLGAGYNLIGFPFVPETMDPFQLFAPVRALARDVQNGKNERTDFETGLNQIGALRIQEGYVVSMKSAAQLTLRGKKILPSENPMVLGPGWHIVPLWSLKPRPAAEAFSSLSGSLIVAKDLEGRSFLPDYGINTLGNLMPGKAYWVFLSKPDTLIYPDAYMQETNTDPVLEPLETPRPEIFRQGRIQRVLESATVVLPLTAMPEVAKAGDEIAVFGPDGRIGGSAVYEGQNLAITVWDLPPGAPCRFKLWKRDENRMLDLDVHFTKAAAAGFEPGGISEVLRLNTPAAVTAFEESWNLYPNPASGSVMLERSQPVSGTALLLHPDGRIARQWTLREDLRQALNLEGIPAGVYYLHWRQGNQMPERRALVIHP